MEKRSRRWEKRDVQDVIARYMAGVDVFTIAEEFGRPVASIRTLIYRHELPRKNAGNGSRKTGLYARPIRVDGR